jgi:hypothetical protein
MDARHFQLPHPGGDAVPATTADFRALTEAATVTWSSGDFNEIGRSLVPAAEDLLRAADPAPTQRVLECPKT